MKLPQVLINSLYGTPNCRESNILTIGSCELANQDITGVVGIIGKIITYVNGFLMLACVLLVIYAGWLVRRRRKTQKSQVNHPLCPYWIHRPRGESCDF